ncbi:putative bifunctional diguanylate cyclase/phosphodiesterase [Raoultibacter phocaeensis]|uniref:putative bifunctional diguanylate cyclase/phosphodiesterase n=1 Tax=Raoultibacter phocaeensis TaxID=2479841 RepID=UPI001C59DB44|nr:GGDEF domain-containing protein [Raoultibacter phocaeensis]
MKSLVQRNNLGIFFALFGVLIVLAAVISGATVMRSTAIATEETERYLAELSQQTTYRINQRMSFNLELLSNLGVQLEIAGQDERTRDEMIDAVIATSPFVWIGYTDLKGNLLVDGRESVDLSDFSAVKKAIAGNPGVSDQLVSVFEGERGALYAAPAPSGDMGAIVGLVAPETMELLLNTDTADGVGFSHIVSREGEFILRSSNQNALLEGSNVFDSLAEQTDISQSEIALMQQAMASGESGRIRYSINNEPREMNYWPLDKGGWYALSVVPPDVYTSSLTNFTHMAIVAVALLALAAFGLFGGYLLWMTARKNREISRIAFVDPVTCGHTMARFDHLVAQRMQKRRPFTFVTLDVSNFRLINDTFGKERGNATLKHIHDTIVANLHDGEIAARISADVFNVVLEELDRGSIEVWLNHLAEEINRINVDVDAPYFLKLNCGVYLVNESETDIVAVRDRSNTARKSERRSGGSLCSCMFFDDIEHARLLREKGMENEMDHALETGEFVVYLQPKVSLDTNEVIGAEALVRWDSPERGLIPPDEFIPFFERNGFIIKLDLNVFEQVCKRLRMWMDSGRETLPISVNLSPVHLRRRDFLKAFEEVRERYDIPAHLLEFELTERVAFESIEQLRSVVDDIHDCGFRCSMDDFGSGYSSLNVLKEIPVDVLKIDRQFFIGNDERGCAVVESVVELAKKLDMGTVAEGVETIPQVEFLRSVECDAVQGYVFSTPVPVDKFEDMVFGDGTAPRSL